jgi:hypothetical protein
MFSRKSRPGEAGEVPVAVPHASEMTVGDSPHPEGSWLADRGAPGGAVDPGSAGWVSREPIVVGDPVSRFEPLPVSAEYRRSPYRPDTVLDGWSTDDFSVRGGSVRGYMHRYEGAPRQDDFAIAERSGGRQVIAAVADGVSQAPQSHIGSSTAVRYACQWLASTLAEPAGAIDWRSMIEGAAWTLVEQARAIDPDCASAAMAEQMLATTLVCAMVEAGQDGGAVAHLVSVGDSGAWVLSSAGYRRVAGGKAEVDGVSSSAVSALPRVPRDIRPVRLDLAEGEVLLLGTDGFGDPLGGGAGLVGELFAQALLPGPPTLTEFGHVLDFSRETFDDDRALIAIWHRGRAAPAPGAVPLSARTP